MKQGQRDPRGHQQRRKTDSQAKQAVPQNSYYPRVVEIRVLHFLYLALHTVFKLPW